MKYAKNLFTLLIVGINATGCASIVTGQNQPVSVETHYKGKAILKANCKLNNDKGTWFVTTPGSITVSRSYSDLLVRCEKDGYDPGILAVKSSTKGMAFGNIIFGGFIGAAVDMGSGAAYDYPSLIGVEMGVNKTLMNPREKSDVEEPVAVSGQADAVTMETDHD